MWTFRDTKTLFRDRRRLLSFCINSAVACRCGCVFFSCFVCSHQTRIFYSFVRLWLYTVAAPQRGEHDRVAQDRGAILKSFSPCRLTQVVLCDLSPSWCEQSLVWNEGVRRYVRNWWSDCCIITCLHLCWCPLLMWWSKDDERNCVSTTQFQPLKILFKRIDICRHIDV